MRLKLQWTLQQKANMNISCKIQKGLDTFESGPFLFFFVRAGQRNSRLTGLISFDILKRILKEEGFLDGIIISNKK